MRFYKESHWISNTLENLCHFYKGNGISKKDLTEEGESCILYGQLYTTYLNEIITKVVYKTKIRLSNPFYSKANDLIIPSSGENPIDIAVARSVQIENVLFGGDLNVLRPNKDINSGFLSYQLNGKRKLDIAKIAQGKSIVHLHNNDLKNIRIYYPYIEEQNKIASLLFKIDQRIETQSKIIKAYSFLIKGLEDKLFWNNDIHQHTYKISNILSERTEKSTIQNQYPILSSTKKGVFLQSDYFNKEAASSNNIGYKITRIGDIIISPQNLWMGNITFNNKFINGLVSPSYHVYKINVNFNSIYVARLLQTNKALFMYNTISEQGASVVRRNLNVNAFNNLSFPIPDISKQDKIGLFLNKFHQLISIEKAILKQYTNQKKYLLNNMFI